MCSVPVYSQPRLLIHRRAAGSFSYLQCNRKIQRAQNYQHASYMGYVSKHMVFIFEKVLLLCPHLETWDSYPSLVTWFPTQGRTETGRWEG